MSKQHCLDAGLPADVAAQLEARAVNWGNLLGVIQAVGQHLPALIGLLKSILAKPPTAPGT